MAGQHNQKPTFYVQPQDYQQDIYLSPQECATTMRVHVDTIKRWCKIGALPAYGRGKTIRIRLADLMQFSPIYKCEDPIVKANRAAWVNNINKSPAHYKKNRVA